MTDKKDKAEDVKAEDLTVSEEQLTPEEEDYKTQMMRIQAEFDNYRKRTEDNQVKFKELFGSGILEQFIPILDHFELAVQHESTDKNYAVGVEMILQQFKTVLKDNGVEEIQTDVFDATMHDAIGTESQSEKNDGAILTVQMKGYKIGEKVLRKAKVIVNKLESEAKAE